MDKFRLVQLLNKLEEEKNKYKILKENSENIKRKSKAFKFISKKIQLLKKEDEKFYALCKEITGDISKEECLKEIKRRINEEQ